MTTRLIGISGWPTSGKGTVGRLIREHYNYKEISFADPLRQVLSIVNPFVDGDMRWNEAMERYGYRAAKDTISEVRRLMHALGTDAGRNYLDPDLWVKPTRRRVIEALKSNPGVVIPDLRLQNEAEMILGLGGIIVRVVRPGVVETTGHISEHDLDNYKFDAILVNDGSFSDLLEQVSQLPLS